VTAASEPRFFRRWRAELDRIFTAAGPSPRAQWLVIGVVLLVCLGARVATIGNPPLDRTAWKEIDYVMISEGYRDNGFWFPRPTLSWPAEEPRFTEMELPVVPYATAALETVFGEDPLVVRAVPLAAWLVLVVYVFLLARRELGGWVGLAAGLATAVIPLYHPFGRLLLSEPAMVAASTATLFHLAEWMDRGRRRDAVLFGVLLCLAIGLKIEALWLFLPIVFLVVRSGRRTWHTVKVPLAVIGAALVVPVVWYGWAAHLERTGVHAFGLFQGHDKFQTVSMLTSWEWYRTMAFRLRTQLLGNVLGVAVAVVGALTALVAWRRASLFLVLAAGGLAHTTIIAEGALDAPYRQLNLVPTLAVFVGLGAVGVAAAVLGGLGARRTARTGVLAAVGAVVLVLVPVAGRVGAIRGSEDPVSPDRWAVAATIRELTDPGDTLALVGEYDPKQDAKDVSPVLFHYAGRTGWNVADEDCSLATVEDLAARGATYFAAVIPFNRDELPACEGEADGTFDAITRTFRTVYSSPELLLVDLTSPAE
jgi:4-amino-4-deoxy-L-arabinose transferase-like glycosyltransferase